MKIFAKLAVIALAGLAGISAQAPVASATPLAPMIEDGMRVDVQHRENRRHYGDERDWLRYRHDVQSRPRHNQCSTWLAVDRARAYGMRSARVVQITPRRVVVEGRQNGRFRTMVFANVRGCPTIRR